VERGKRPLARSLRDLRSDGAEHIPFAVFQTAQVFITTSIFHLRFTISDLRKYVVSVKAVLK
jgi:hypothetical protein